MCDTMLISEEKEIGGRILNNANSERHNTFEEVKVTRLSRCHLLLPQRKYYTPSY